MFIDPKLKDLTCGRIEVLTNKFNTQPYCKHLSIKVLDINPKECTATLKMDIKPEFFIMYGIVHGGILGCLADSAAAAVILASLKEDEQEIGTTSIESKINYIRPVKEQGEIFANARIIHRGHNMVVAETEVLDSNGKLIAVELSTFLIIKRDKS